MAKSESRGKAFLIFLILVLFLAALCLAAGIAATLPARAEQVFGPPSPNLSPTKLYQQSLTLLLSQNKLFEPGDLSGGETYLPVEQGESLDSILAGLTHLGLVRHSSEFRAYLIYSGIDTRIQPGEFYFPAGLSEIEVADMLSGPASQLTTVSILAGWRAEEITENLSGIGLSLDPGIFLEIIRNENKEGYLFPGNYQVDREISPQGLVDQIYENFISHISQDFESRVRDQGLTMHEAVILASIVEREAVVDEEKPIIASVFLNRLKMNINLGADPTVQYALGFNEAQSTWWTNPLSLDDLKLPSSYNTYVNPGLPPGPICNPGLSALQAVANPAETTYLYFRAACDGSGLHIFAETFEEHLGNACE